MSSIGFIFFSQNTNCLDVFDWRSRCRFALTNKKLYGYQKKIANQQLKKRAQCEEIVFSKISNCSVFSLLHNLNEIEAFYPEILINIIGRVTFILIPIFHHLNGEHDKGFYGDIMSRGTLNDGRPYLNLGTKAMKFCLQSGNEKIIVRMSANFIDPKFRKNLNEWTHELLILNKQYLQSPIYCEALNSISSDKLQKEKSKLSQALLRYPSSYKREEVLCELLRSMIHSKQHKCTIL